MRSFRHELFSTAAVLSVPAAVLLAFPFEAIGFKASPVPSNCPSSAAFVTLTPEQEAAALVAAKTAWQSDAAPRRRIRLPLGELPEETPRPLLEIGAGVCPADVPEPIVYLPQAWNPSLRSGAPSRLPSKAAVRPAPAFPREELLKLN